MSLSGTVADTSIAELLVSLADGKKSGRLRLSHRTGEGLVLFDRGLIAYAGSDSPREKFGSILVAEKHITEPQLAQALDLQRAMGSKSLGSILVELGFLTSDAMRRAVRLQVRRAITDMLDWAGAHYEFQPMEVGSGGYLSLPLAEVYPEAMPEAAGDPTPIDEAPDPADDEPIVSEAPESRQALLGQMADEVRSPEFTGEMVTRVLGLASHVVRRAVLFLCRPDGFCGIGQTGIELPGGGADEAVRSLVIPLDQPSILREAFEARDTVQRSLAHEGGDAPLIDALGGGLPSEAVAGPTTVDDRVMMILYGDNLPDAKPIGSILELDLMLIQTGLRVENNLLRKRIRHFESVHDLDRRAKPAADQGEP